MRAPKIYGFIRGFQRWVWWPKCAPASINSCMVTVGAAIIKFLSGYASGKREQPRGDPAGGTGCNAFHVNLPGRSTTNAADSGLTGGHIVLSGEKIHPQFGAKISLAIAISA
ncbi:hypothetical protein AEB_P2772 [Altererythrobacter sp. B11]|nr:hypothetical protein AEB_P2772 [Altererythrobacter sp. B11]